MLNAPPQDKVTISGSGAAAIPVAADPKGEAQPAGSVGTAAAPVDSSLLHRKVANLFDQANNKAHSKDDKSERNWLARCFGAQGRTYDAALRDLVSGPITQDKLETFLEEFYGASGVSDEFWAAFTGNGEDGVLANEQELIDCLENFMDNMQLNGGEALRYMCDNTKIYVIPVSGRLAGDLKTMGIDHLLARAPSAFVKQAWEGAKRQHGKTESEAKDDPKVWDTFAKILSFRFWQQYPEKFDLSKFNNARGRTKELVGELSDQYLRRWLVAEEGLKEREFRGLVDRQAAIAKLEEQDPKLLDGVTLTPFKKNRAGQTATEVFVTAIDLYRADPGGNQKKVEDALASLRDFNANGAAPVPPAATYLASTNNASQPQ